MLSVEILGLDRDDIVVVREFTRLGGKSEVGDSGHFVVFNLEAFGPFVLLLVLQLELEGFVGEVGEFGFGGDLSVADSTGLGLLA